MSVLLTCPECQKRLKVDNSVVGKKIKCPGCAAVFAAAVSAPQEEPPADDDEVPVASRRPSGPTSERKETIRTDPKPPPARPAEDDEEDDRPRRRAARKDRKDDEDDRPRPARRKRRREDEDEEDERRGRSAVARQKKVSGCAVTAMIVGSIGVLLVVGCAGAVYYFISRAGNEVAGQMTNLDAQAARQRAQKGGEPLPAGPGPAPAPGPGPGPAPPPARGPAGGGLTTSTATKPGPVLSPLPSPAAGSGLGVGAKPEAIGDLTVRPLILGVGQGPACLCWSKDGRAFYHLDGTGTVRRISFPEFKEEAALPTAKKCGWLSTSAQGVVLTVNDAQEMWLLDAQSLKPGARVPIATSKRVASSPALSHAYAADMSPEGGTLSVIDLKAGRVVKQFRNTDFINEGVNFDYPVATDDGKHLFTTGGFGPFYRFDLDGAAVKFGDASPGFLSGRFEGLCVSPDGKFVCAPSGGGNGAAAGESQPPPYSTAIFGDSNLKKPLLRLASGAYPMAVGFDTKSGLLYAQNFQNQLVLYDTEGIKLKEYNLAKGGGGSTRQFLVHPDGRKLLVMGEGGDAVKPAQLWYVELSAGK
jgi:hypothetical protein